MAVETEGQDGNGIEFPSKDVMFFEKSSVLSDKFALDRAQHHKFVAPAQQTNGTIPWLGQ
jgi:hypothetical protein